jgi:amidase
MFGPRRLKGTRALLAAQTELSERASKLSVWMAEHPLVVAPVVGMEPPPIDFDRDLTHAEGVALFDRMRNAVWVNLFGLPALALPNGMQLVGRRLSEEEMLEAAAAIEADCRPEPLRPLVNQSPAVREERR